MVKKIPIESLQEHGWHYITAITKPQVESLVKKNVFQLGLFEEKLAEIIHDKIRYLLRRNPQRVLEIGENRKEKMQKVKDLCKKLCEKLKTKPKKNLKSLDTKKKKRVSGLFPQNIK